MPDRQAELRLLLRALKLPAIAAVYADLALKAAKANLTHEAFLYELVRAECLQREEHRVARLQRLSGLPPDKTFRTLQLERFPPLIREQLERLAERRLPGGRGQRGRRRQAGRRQIACPGGTRP